MKAYLIECGSQYILHVDGTHHYHLLSSQLFNLFTSAQPDFNHLTDGQSFPSNDPELLNFFCNPKENIGAIIAERSTDHAHPRIFHRYRYQQLSKQFIF